MTWIAMAFVSGGSGDFGQHTTLAQTATRATAPRVEMVLVTEPGFSPANMRPWHDMLVELGVANLQIRSATGTDKVQVESLGTPQNPRYRVTGKLTARNELVVPGGRFSRQSRSSIQTWLTQLSAEGPNPQPKLAFGLTAEELAALRSDLSRGVEVNTKGRSPRELLDSVGSQLSTPLVAEAAIAEQLAKAAAMRDELQGLSAGTALAAALRPEGLALVPRLNGERRLELAVVVARGQTEVWPVGWQSEKSEADLVPALFETRNVEVAEIPVATVLDAIGSRLETPMLYDHNSLALHGTDLQKRVSVARSQTAYTLALQRVLTQAQMKYEVRVDEAGKPLVWIMSNQP